MVKYTINNKEEDKEECYNIYLELRSSGEVYVMATNNVGTTKNVARIYRSKGIAIPTSEFNFKYMGEI